MFELEPEDSPGHSCPLLQGRCLREGCSDPAQRSTTRARALWLWLFFCGAFVLLEAPADGLVRSNWPQGGGLGR